MIMPILTKIIKYKNDLSIKTLLVMKNVTYSYKKYPPIKTVKTYDSDNFKMIIKYKNYLSIKTL